MTSRNLRALLMGVRTTQEDIARQLGVALRTVQRAEADAGVRFKGERYPLPGPSSRWYRLALIGLAVARDYPLSPAAKAAVAQVRAELHVNGFQLLDRRVFHDLATVRPDWPGAQ